MKTCYFSAESTNLSQVSHQEKTFHFACLETRHDCFSSWRKTLNSFEKERRKSSHLGLIQSFSLTQSSSWMIWTPFSLTDVSPWPQKLVCCRWGIPGCPACCCCCSRQTFEALVGCTRDSLHSRTLLRPPPPPSTRSSCYYRCCTRLSPGHEQTCRLSSLPTETPLKKVPCPWSLLSHPSP